VPERLCVPYTMPPNVEYVVRIRAVAEQARGERREARNPRTGAAAPPTRPPSIGEGGRSAVTGLGHGAAPAHRPRVGAGHGHCPALAPGGHPPLRSGPPEYTSIAYGQRCRVFGVRPSMGTVDDAYDKAMCESFFATLECELLWRTRFRSQAEARRAIFEFIEGWYNSHRRHSALAYDSPIRFEQRHRTAPSTVTAGKTTPALPLESTIAEGRYLTIPPIVRYLPAMKAPPPLQPSSNC
jgi:hypothetical protein